MRKWRRFIYSCSSKTLVNEANQTEDYNEFSYVLLYQTSNKKKILQEILERSLVPGMIFTYCSKMFYGVNFLTDKPVYDFIVILIIGLIISRIGSVIVEPLLKKSKNS